MMYNKNEKNNKHMMHKNNKKGEKRMTEAAKEARRAYRREWARKNRDKVRNYQELYWQRKAEKALEPTEKTEGRCNVCSQDR